MNLVSPNEQARRASLRREETLIDLENRLERHGKCMLVRCTGFGKTWMLTSLIKKYNSVLYLYPADVVKNTVVDRYNEDLLGKEFRRENDYDESTVENTVFMTYMKLIRLSDEDIRNMDFDLVIFDEAHRLGGRETKRIVRKLFKHLEPKNARFVGATATPERSDSFDIIDEFFDNVCVKQYTLHDAIRDGIIKRPYYVYCCTDHQKSIEDGVKKSGYNLKDSDVMEVIQRKVMYANKVYNMDNIIYETLKKYRGKDNYYKFIVFFADLSHIDDYGDKVAWWFKSAFKGWSLSTLTVTSNSKEESENVNKLKNLVPRDKHIDLVYCVDMLNMGYHINDLTGIVMYRGTSSSIIFNQQLGRALSSGNSEACVVFDVVDNLHRKATFDLRNTSKESLIKRDTINKISKFIQSGITVDDIDVMSDKDIIAMSEICKSEDVGTIIDLNGSSPRDIKPLRNRLKKLLEDGAPQWWKFCNTVSRDDVILTGHEAKYYEFITKTCAEPLAYRARGALINHLIIFMQLRGMCESVYDFKLYDLRVLDDGEFCKAIKTFIIDNDITYPFYNKDKFIELFLNGDEDSILNIKRLLQSAGTSIERFMELLEVANDEELVAV